MSIERRTLAGTFAGIGGFAVTLLQSLLTVPLLLHYWGTEQYGVWVAVSTLTTLFAALDAGHQGYLGNEFNKDVAAGAPQLRRTLASGLRIALVLGLVQLAGAIALLNPEVAGRFLGVAPGVVEAGRLGWAIVILVADWFVLSTMFGVLGRLYAPYGQYARATVLGIGQRLALFAVLVAVVVLGGGIFEYAVAYSAVAAAIALFWFVEIRRRFPDLYPWWEGGSWGAGLANFSRSVVLTLNGVATQLASNGLNLIIAAGASAAMIPAFSTVRTLSNMFYQSTSIVLTPLIPDLARLHVTGQWEKIRHLFRAAWFATGLTLNLGIVVIAPAVPFLFGWWTGGQIPFAWTLFATLATSVSVRSATAPMSIYLSGLNDLGVQSAATLAQAGSTLLTAIVASRSFGLAGFGLGVLVGEIAGMIVYLACAVRRIGDSGGFGREFAWLAAAPTALVAVVLAGIAWQPQAAGIFALAGGLALLCLYGLQWRGLPMELKSRIHGALSPARRRPA